MKRGFIQHQFYKSVYSSSRSLFCKHFLLKSFKYVRKTGAGFTLIETLIYIALFALIMGSGVAASFYVIDSSEKEKTSINAIADAQFFLRKIDWAITGADSINLPLAGTGGSSLSVNKNGFSSNPIVIDLLSEHARIATGTGSPIELTGDRVIITNLLFQNIPAAPPKPAAIKATFTANGANYELTRYLRK